MKREKITAICRHKDDMKILNEAGGISGMSIVDTNFDFKNLIRKIKIAKLYGIKLDKNYNRVDDKSI